MGVTHFKSATIPWKLSDPHLTKVCVHTEQAYQIVITAPMFMLRQVFQVDPIYSHLIWEMWYAFAMLSVKYIHTTFIIMEKSQTNKKLLHLISPMIPKLLQWQSQPSEYRESVMLQAKNP